MTEELGIIILQIESNRAMYRMAGDWTFNRFQAGHFTLGQYKWIARSYEESAISWSSVHPPMMTDDEIRTFLDFQPTDSKLQIHDGKAQRDLEISLASQALPFETHFSQEAESLLSKLSSVSPTLASWAKSELLTNPDLSRIIELLRDAVGTVSKYRD